MIDRKISIAPMMDWTDRFYRYFARLLTKHTLLYTEMIHVNAVLRGNREKLLAYDPLEHPVALQLGGSDPKKLADAAVIVEEYGYDEINLNIGCPSERVQAGSFGACLMAEPMLVAECVAAMQGKVNIPVTVKCRIGIDKQDDYDYLYHFIDTVQESGCKIFIIHARAAWLKGLSPKENREIPPLRYEYVYRLKQDFPELTISINGGIKTLEQAMEHLHHVDGVMIGREAYHNPYILSKIDQAFYNDDHVVLSRYEVLKAYLPFLEKELQKGVRLSTITRHLLGLLQGEPGAREYRRVISGNDIDFIKTYLNRMVQYQ